MSGAKTTPPDLQKALQTPIWPIWRVLSVESFASMPDPPVRATASAGNRRRSTGDGAGVERRRARHRRTGDGVGLERSGVVADYWGGGMPSARLALARTGTRRASRLERAPWRAPTRAHLVLGFVCESAYRA